MRTGSASSRRSTRSSWLSTDQIRSLTYSGSVRMFVSTAQGTGVGVADRYLLQVQLIIQQDKVRKNSAAILNRLAHPYGIDSASCSIGFQKPWLCTPQEECQYRVCQNCRPGCADRAFLSLNAVANGEVLPTAAAGYSFHLLGQRPVVDANVLKNIGCRPVPLVSSSDDDSTYIRSKTKRRTL